MQDNFLPAAFFLRVMILPILVFGRFSAAFAPHMPVTLDKSAGIK